MKNAVLLFLVLCLATTCYGQRLGFSSFSPYGGQNETENHTFYYNTGEALTNRSPSAPLRINNGLLYNQAVADFPDSYLQIKFFLDENKDGVKDINETYLGLGAVQVNNSDFYLNTSPQGILFYAAGDYTIKYDDLDRPGWLLTTPEEVSVSLGGPVLFVEVEYGLARDEAYSEVTPSLSMPRFRCFSPADYELVAHNTGFFEEENTVWLRIDERIEEIFFTVEPDVIISEHYVGWNYLLGPGEKLIIPFNVTVPAVSDELPPGTLFDWKIWIESTPKKEACYTQELRCSWDPNDKLVNPNRPDSLGLIAEPIEYTIRFQNTGNDYAEDIVVTDTISDHLDMSTFTLINSSHNDLLKVEFNKDNRRIINFRFDNIYLLDSIANEPESHGFIMYSIEAVEGLPLNTEINNTAHIYFDFNPAVVTNTTSTTLVDVYPIISVNEPEEELIIEVYPNPTTGIVVFDQSIDKVNVFDLNGRLLTEHFDIQKMDLSDLGAGTFVLKLHKDDKYAVEKIIVLK